MARKKNPFGQTVNPKDAYAVYYNPQMGMTWYVLKTYQHPDNERKNKYARWLVAAKSPMTYGSLEYGDTYAVEVMRWGQLVEATPEWDEHYTYQELSLDILEDIGI